MAGLAADGTRAAGAAAASLIPRGRTGESPARFSFPHSASSLISSAIARHCADVRVT